MLLTIFATSIVAISEHPCMSFYLSFSSSKNTSFICMTWRYNWDNTRDGQGSNLFKHCRTNDILFYVKYIFSFQTWWVFIKIFPELLWLRKETINVWFYIFKYFLYIAIFLELVAHQVHCIVIMAVGDCFVLNFYLGIFHFFKIYWVYLYIFEDVSYSWLHSTC